MWIMTDCNVRIRFLRERSHNYREKNLDILMILIKIYNNLTRQLIHNYMSILIHDFYSYINRILVLLIYDPIHRLDYICFFQGLLNITRIIVPTYDIDLHKSRDY